MKTKILDNNTQPALVERLLAGEPFFLSHRGDEGKRYQLAYDDISDYYWFEQRHQLVPLAWVVGIAADFVYLDDRMNEARRGRRYGFYLSDAVFDPLASN